MGKRLGAILLAIPLSGAGLLAILSPHTAAGAAAQPTCEGATVSGVLLNGESPVIVEKESIFLNIGKLPAVGAPDDLALNAVYDACVTTKYTFFNPTGEDATLSLLFPQASRPSYISADCADFHAITANGLPVETEMRHSYVGYYSRTLDFSSSLMQIVHGQAVDSFYADAELPVCEYLFRVNVPEAAIEDHDKKMFTFALTFECNPARTRILSRSPMTAVTENGRLQARFDVTAGENTVSLTTIGEDIENLTYGVYTDLFCTEMLETETPSIFRSVTTFPAYALRFRPQGSQISDRDWFGGFVQMLTKNTNASNKCVIYGSPDSLREEAFMQWYSYELTVPAFGWLEHAVCSPLYPTADENGFEYSYLLSSQQRWSKVKSVEIAISTPYRLAYSSLSFETREGGYYFKRERLPVGELTFTLTESEAPMPETDASASTFSLSPILWFAIALIALLLLLGLLAAAIVLPIVLVNRKRRKQQQRGEPPASP